MNLKIADLVRMHDRGVLEHFIEQNKLSHEELLHTVIVKVSEREKDWSEKVSELETVIDVLKDVIDNPF